MTFSCISLQVWPRHILRARGFARCKSALPIRLLKSGSGRKPIAMISSFDLLIKVKEKPGPLMSKIMPILQSCSQKFSSKTAPTNSFFIISHQEDGRKPFLLFPLYWVLFAIGDALFRCRFLCRRICPATDPGNSAGFFSGLASLESLAAHT